MPSVRVPSVRNGLSSIGFFCSKTTTSLPLLYSLLPTTYSLLPLT
ncbi:hypothetical protein [Moorena sp. SIO4A5]|nr:hypothetical protein [Moorena sp. SIO4A5]